MPYMCCVVKCCNSVLNPGRKNFSFHRFPKDETLLSKWLENINRPNFAPTKHTRICSGHFEDWCFQREEGQLKAAGIAVHRRSLRPEAIPTIFNLDNIMRDFSTKIRNRKSKKKDSADEVATTDDSSQSSKPSDSMPAAYNQSYNHHTVGGNYDGAPAVNGHGTAWDERTSPESDTYELTELTPMVKPERPSPVAPAYEDNSAYHVITDLDDPFQAPIKESLALAPTIGLMGALPNNANHTVYSDAFKKCIISESFLYALLKLIKCPQCGFGTNSEQMQKYENQGCILGVRLLCYNGHLVLDWRL